MQQRRFSLTGMLLRFYFGFPPFCPGVFPSKEKLSSFLRDLVTVSSKKNLYWNDELSSFLREFLTGNDEKNPYCHNVGELKKLCKERGLPTAGTKHDLIAQLLLLNMLEDYKKELEKELKEVKREIEETKGS